MPLRDRLCKGQVATLLAATSRIFARQQGLGLAGMLAWYSSALRRVELQAGLIGVSTAIVARLGQLSLGRTLHFARPWPKQGTVAFWSRVKRVSCN